jgi:hypothetical protein
MRHLQRARIREDHIQVGLFINQFWSINQIDGSFAIQAYLNLSWYDARLCFNDSRLPRDQNTIELDRSNRMNTTTGVDFLHSMWLPDVNIQNSIRLSGDIAPDADLFHVKSNGFISWSRRFVVTLSADFEFTALPFDKQTLFVDLESYRMPSEAVQLEWDLSGANGIDKDFNNVEWQFLDIDPDPPPSAKKDHPFSQNDRSDLDELVERTLPSRGQPAVVAGVGASACIKSFCSSSCPLLCRAGNRQYEGDTKQFSRVSYVIYLKRHVTQWILGYIVTSVLLLFASYLGLFIKNDNPGRPA